MASTKRSGLVANVGLLTDLLIANLPAEGLRSVLRALVSSHPTVILDLHHRSSLYLRSVYTDIHRSLEEDVSCTEHVMAAQAIINSFAASSLNLESLTLMTRVLEKCSDIFEKSFGNEERRLSISVDNDIAQVLSRVSTSNLQTADVSILQDLSSSIERLRDYYLFERSAAILSLCIPDSRTATVAVASKKSILCSPEILEKVEMFHIGERGVPRVFTGLWQLSSSAWGVSPLEHTVKGFESYIRSGFTAFDMADIYGDVEVIFGELRSLLENPEVVFAATKYCTFDSNANVSDQVQRFVSQRLQRLRVEVIDLLQLHWHNYLDTRFLDVLRLLQGDTRVSSLGLCNFDTEHMEVVLREGINVKTNQVQFSLIDSRPTVRMARVCKEHNVKILAYGTLCGGFISESWRGKPEPHMFAQDITPSQRKYYEMIVSWGGWDLFQELLTTLSTIAQKYNVSMSNVATRWVLDHPYVGAVIIGSRMGIREHAEDNLAVYGWHLDIEDQAAIKRVLAQSRREEMFHKIGDCGSEHR